MRYADLKNVFQAHAFKRMLPPRRRRRRITALLFPKSRPDNNGAYEGSRAPIADAPPALANLARIGSMQLRI